MKMLFPQALKPGDTIAIVSPASSVKDEYIDGAAAALTGAGYKVKIYPSARGRQGTYSAPAQARAADLIDALSNPEVRAVLCSRGGYGCVHLLPALETIDVSADPKWLVGFSDVSALHAFMRSRGVVSIHGSMAKALANHLIDAPFNQTLLSLLQGERRGLTFPTHKYNNTGEVTAPLVGGNLAVLQALISTPYDLFDNSILVIEDIAEPIYKVERILWQLRLAGRLDNLRGVVVGQFTLYEPDANYNDIYDMIHEMLAPVVANHAAPFPIAFNAPVGHIEQNMPLLHGATYTLRVDDGVDTSLMPL